MDATQENQIMLGAGFFDYPRDKSKQNEENHFNKCTEKKVVFFKKYGKYDDLEVTCYKCGCSKIYYATPNAFRFYPVSEKNLRFTTVKMLIQRVRTDNYIFG